MIKPETVRKTAEILLARIVPGGLNVVALLALAAWLSRESYGIASTYIATAIAAGDVLFGPITRSTLVHHSEHWARGKQDRYESLHVANTAFLSVAVALAGLVLVWFGVVDLWIVAAAIASGAYASVQEITHARLQFYRCAVGSSSQSLVFLLLAFLIVRADPTPSRALEAFAISYATGALVSAILVKPRITWPSIRLMKTGFGLGGLPTFSNLAVNFFTLGCRYLLMLFGQREALGILSFSLDIAQRGVGIFINFAAFAIVPLALRSADTMDPWKLWRRLARGWAVAVLVSALGAAAIMVAATTDMVAALNSPVYDPVSFALICVAVIVNRSSKMVLAPVAMRVRRTRALVTPLIVIAPAGLALTALGLYLKVPYVVEIVYTGAFIVWAAASYHSLAPQLRGDTCE